MDPDQRMTLYQMNQASMLLHITVSWSAGDFVPEEPDQNAVL